MPYRLRRILRFTLGTLFIIGIAVYAFYQSQVFLQGPVIDIVEPLNGSTLKEPLIIVTGTSKNIARIFMNDRQIFVDEEGLFEEKLLLLSGYNIISLRAEDKFGRDLEKSLELVLAEEQQDIDLLETIPDITSTTSTSSLPEIDAGL